MNMKSNIMEEEIECNVCGNIMFYNDEEGIYECGNQECTNCNI